MEEKKTGKTFEQRLISSLRMWDEKVDLMRFNEFFCQEAISFQFY